MPRMTICGTALFKQKLADAPSRAGLADALGVSLATVDKLVKDQRGVGARVIAGALAYWAPTPFEHLFAVVPDDGS